MGLLDGRGTRTGKYGRCWPDPKKSKRKRFCAWFERGMDIRVKNFSTRKAAHDWLRQQESTQ